MFAGEAASDDREAIASLGLSDTQFIAASREALALIEREWTAVERVARALMSGRALRFDEVELIAIAGESGGD